jgi:hypothetical protein
MKIVRSYRVLASLCRQQAIFNPQDSRKWLDQAERLEHLADFEIAIWFQECNTRTWDRAIESPQKGFYSHLQFTDDSADLNRNETVAYSILASDDLRG